MTGGNLLVGHDDDGDDDDDDDYENNFKVGEGPDWPGTSFDVLIVMVMIVMMVMMAIVMMRIISKVGEGPDWPGTSYESWGEIPQVQNKSGLLQLPSDIQMLI